MRSRSLISVRRAGHRYGRGARPALLVADVARARVPALPGRRAPRHQAGEPAAGRARPRQDLRLRHGDRVPARRSRAAAGARLRHRAVRGARGAARSGAAVPGAARGRVGRRARAARHARRRSVPH